MLRSQILKVEKLTPASNTDFFFFLEETEAFLKKWQLGCFLKLYQYSNLRQCELLPTAGSGQGKKKPAKH